MTDFLKKMRMLAFERAAKIQPKSLPLNTLDFCEIFTDRTQPVIISEIKFASPTHANLYPGLQSATQIATNYLRAGANALSILTEPTCFKGDIDFIADIRKIHANTPILLKDFIVSRVQIQQALLYGANAVLLIATMLTQSELIDLYHYSLSLGLTPIIEIHNQAELAATISLSPQVILINQRNLFDLSINREAYKLIDTIPKSIYVICASAIESREQIDTLHTRGFAGFLIGSSLMRHCDPGAALFHLLKGDPHAR